MAKIWPTKDRYWFWCPGCQENHAPSTDWKFNDDIHKPTFEPSILVRTPIPETNPVQYSRICHSFVTNGQIQFLTDCTHALAGKTIDLPEWE